jgi:hypothetical protein
MNTLGSWIDQEAFTGIARDIAPVVKTTASPWFADDTAPVTRLMADDFRLPEHFTSAPFPEAPAAMAAPERAKVRNFLDNIRHKAEQSGLIPRVPSASGDAPPGSDKTSVPPAWGSVGASHNPPPFPPASPSPLLPMGIAAPVPTASLRGPLGALTTVAAAESAAPPPRRHVPHFEVPLGPLTTRLRALTDWIRRQIDAADIFIIDAQGCPVSDREASGEIVAGVLLLAEAARRAAPHLPSAAEGAIYLDLQDERRLCVIDTATRHGIFTLGLIVPDALAPRAADRLRRALRRTVEAENQSAALPPRERW